MMKLNKKAESLGAVLASASDSTATETSATGAAGTAASETNFDYGYSSIDFPLWKVALGAGSPAAKYTVPNMAAPKDASTACGHANSACAAAPATWDGGP